MRGEGGTGRTVFRKNFGGGEGVGRANTEGKESRTAARRAVSLPMVRAMGIVKRGRGKAGKVEERAGEKILLDPQEGDEQSCRTENSAPAEERAAWGYWGYKNQGVWAIQTDARQRDKGTFCTLSWSSIRKDATRQGSLTSGKGQTRNELAVLQKESVSLCFDN